MLAKCYLQFLLRSAPFAPFPGRFPGADRPSGNRVRIFSSGALRGFEPLPGFVRFLAPIVTEWMTGNKNAIAQNPPEFVLWGRNLFSFAVDLYRPVSSILKSQRYAGASVAHALRIEVMERKPCAICGEWFQAHLRGRSVVDGDAVGKIGGIVEGE
jgi:hypothetical protein